MLDSRRLQRIRDDLLGVPSDPRSYGGLNSTVYLQQIRDALLGVSPAQLSGNLHEKIYLQQIRNAILNVPDGQFGGLPNSIYLQQILNASQGIPDGKFGSLPENAYLDAIIANGLVKYLLRDDFNDTRAPGAVNGTQATPSGGTRTCTDVNSKITIGSGVLNVAAGAAANDEVKYTVATLARVAGRTMVAEYTPADTSQHTNIVLHTAGLGLQFITSARVFALPAALAFTYALATSYKIALVYRATGIFHFMKGGTLANWTLVYVTNVTATAGYPGFNLTGTGAFTSNFLRIPQALTVIQPIASDGFGTSEALGNTRGAGSEESGGTGLAYTKVGTWASNGAVAACSALAGGKGAAVVDAGKADVVVEVIATRTAGTSGLCLRYTDANNYIKCVHNGTNLQVIEVVAGVPQAALVNAAAAYGATKRMIVALFGNKLRAFYGDTLVGAEVTTVITTGTQHGLFTDDTGATFDTLVVWPRGTSGEYEGTFNRYAS